VEEEFSYAKQHLAWEKLNEDCDIALHITPECEKLWW
jgi:hypothetical protein